MLESIADYLTHTALRDHVLWALMNVPGLPPVAQAIHILAVAMIVASSVMIALRFLGLAVPSQSPSEMLERLMPFTWWALPLLLITGGLFIIARPERYFHNPIALWKFGMLACVVLLSLAVSLCARMGAPSGRGFWERNSAGLLLVRSLSVVTLGLWIAIIFAGRWIAYVDYLIY
jgi:hypothetical protein